MALCDISGFQGWFVLVARNGMKAAMRFGGVGTGGADENDGEAGVACDRKVADPQGPATPAWTSFSAPSGAADPFSS